MELLRIELFLIIAALVVCMALIGYIFPETYIKNRKLILICFLGAAIGVIIFFSCKTLTKWDKLNSQELSVLIVENMKDNPENWSVEPYRLQNKSLNVLMEIYHNKNKDSTIILYFEDKELRYFKNKELNLIINAASKVEKEQLKIFENKLKKKIILQN